MAFNTTRPIRKISGNAAGNTLTIDMPIGLTTHKIAIALATWTVAVLNEFRVIINGEPIQRYPSTTATLGLSGGQVLDTINQFNGLSAAGTEVVIDFDRANLLTKNGQVITAIGTGLTTAVANQLSVFAQAAGNPVTIQPDPNPATTFTVEVDIDALAGAGSVSRVVAYQSDPVALGLIKILRAFNYAPTGAGVYQINDLPKGDPINKIYIFNNGSFSRARLELDGYIAFDRTPAENNRLQTDGVRVPQANLFVIDPTEQGFGSSSIVTADVSSMMLELDMTGADDLLVLVEYMGTISN